MAGARRGRDPGRLARATCSPTSCWTSRRSTVQGGLPAAEAFLSLVEGRTDLAPGGSLGLDPLGLQAASGEPQDLSGLADVARRAAAHQGLRAVVVDATVFADAGASAVEELGCSLAAGVAYLRALTDGGLSVDEAFGQLEFRYAASADQFTTIAGLRAARRLWDRVGEVSGASPEVRGAAAARRHLVGDDDEARPVGQHAADDGRLLRRGRGRRRRRHRAAVRRRARPARRLLPADRAQHPEPAGRGGAPGPRARSGRRLLVRRVADRLAGAGGLGLVHRDRAGRRPGRGAGLGPGPRPDRRRVGRPRRAAGHRAPTRSPASASSRTWRRSCRRASRLLPARRSPPLRRAARGSARRRSSRSCATRGRRRTAARSTSRRSGRSPGTPPGPRSRATCSRPAGSRRRPGTALAGFAEAGTTVACICGTDKDYAASARRRWPPS